MINNGDADGAHFTNAILETNAGGESRTEVGIYGAGFKGLCKAVDEIREKLKEKYPDIVL